VTPYYSDDHVTIYHGDCREILPRLNRVDLICQRCGASASLPLGMTCGQHDPQIVRQYDVVVTDPPYGIGWKRSANPARLSKSHDGIANDEDTTCRDDALALTGAGPAVVFGSFYAAPPINVRQWLVWHKGDTQGVVGSTTGYRRDAEPLYLVGDWPIRNVAWSSVLRSVRGSWNDELGETGHPHTKPVDLMRTIIDRCPPGVILDPFMGSGTTLRAAKDLGRKAIGIEIDERYCEIAARRMAQEVLAL